jgi:hypothetical protein
MSNIAREETYNQSVVTCKLFYEKDIKDENVSLIEMDVRETEARDESMKPSI